MLPSSSGLRCRPLTAESGVRIPLGVPITEHASVLFCFHRGRCAIAHQLFTLVFEPYSSAPECQFSRFRDILLLVA